jgi:hypothetical protein
VFVAQRLPVSEAGGTGPRPSTLAPGRFHSSSQPLVLYALAGCVVAAGLVLRAIVYRSSIGYVDADEAVWGLMARHAFDGQLSSFYWGQAYGGTQEVIAVALLFAIGGTHVFLMRAVPILLSAAAAIVVWRIGRRTLGELQGVVAGLVFWIWPPYLIWKLNVWHGFYGTGVLYAALIVLFVLRLDEAPNRRDAIVLGLLLGLAFWQSVQILPIAAPALIWLTLRRPAVWRHAWLAAPAAVVGALPWLVSNLRHDWWSFDLPSDQTPYATRLRGGFSATFPMQLGLRVPFSSDWLLGPILSPLVYAAAAAIFVVLGWRFRKSRLSLLFLILAAFPFLYAASGLTWLTNEPRYVVVIAPALAVLFAWPATTLPRAALVLAVAGAVSATVLGKWIAWSHDNSQAAEADRKTVDIRPVIRELDRMGIGHAYADYWIAYRITFETRERVIASELDLAALAPVGPRRVLPPVPRRPTDHRHSDYDRAVRDARRHAYLLLEHAPHTAADRRLLLRHGYTARKVGHLLLLASPARKAEP